MHLVITGGSGFIGSALVLAALAAGHQVTNIDALTYAANPASLLSVASSERYHFVHADIRDQAAMAAIIERHAPDCILHLAAESHVDRSITGARIFLETNIMGTAALLEAAKAYWSGLDGARRDNFRFIHVSTDEVFGSLGTDGHFTASSPYDPSSPYSSSKAASDHLARAWARTYGLPVIVTNCSNNYGPRQFPEKLIPLMILNALEGKELPVYGQGQQIRDWLHVEDHADALLTVAGRGIPGETYLVGGNNERTNLSIVEAICDRLDQLLARSAPHRGLIRFVTDRPGHDYRYAIDASHIAAALGWQPRYRLEEGLAATIDWYLNNEDWWRPLRAGAGDGRRLGLAS